MPISHRHESIEAAASNDPNFCLKKDEDLLYLDHKHAYYYQVQTQMFVCNVEYCDFCVCTFPESVDEFSPHVERIFRDIEFLEVLNSGKTVLKKPNIFSQYVCYLRYWENGTLDRLFHQVPISPTKATPLIMK